MGKVVVFVGVALLILSVVGLLAPNLAKAIGHFAPAPGRVSPPETVTVDGAIARLKLSPNGRHVHGFYLDDGTEVNLPPNAHETRVGEVGQRVEVDGWLNTSLAGESLMNATRITNTDTNETIDIYNLPPPAESKHGKA